MKRILVFWVTAAIGIGGGLLGGIQVQKRLSASEYQKEIREREVLQKEESTKQHSELERARSLNLEITEKLVVNEAALADEMRRNGEQSARLTERENEMRWNREQSVLLTERAKTQMRIRILGEILAEGNYSYVTNSFAKLPLEHLSTMQKQTLTNIGAKTEELVLETASAFIKAKLGLEGAIEIRALGQRGDLVELIKSLKRSNQLQAEIARCTNAMVTLQVELKKLGEHLARPNE